MKNQRSQRDLILPLALAGLFSALITVGSAYPLGRLHLDFIPGTIFGVLVSSCLMYYGFLRNPFRVVGIAVVSTLAYFASVMVAGAVELHAPFGRPPGESGTVSVTALFAGGLLGAFILLSISSVLLSVKVPWWRQLSEAFAWSFVGGVFGIVGWQLGPSLGMAISRVVHSVGLTSPTETFQNALLGQTSHAYSLWVVWQTGVGTLLGLVLRTQENRR